MRTACIIAVSKSKDIFEPLIHQVSLWVLPFLQQTAVALPRHVTAA